MCVHKIASESKLLVTLVIHIIIAVVCYSFPHTTNSNGTFKDVIIILKTSGNFIKKKVEGFTFSSLKNVEYFKYSKNKHTKNENKPMKICIGMYVSNENLLSYIMYF